MVRGHRLVEFKFLDLPSGKINTVSVVFFRGQVKHPPGQKDDGKSKTNILFVEEIKIRFYKDMHHGQSFDETVFQ